jgi:glyoxylate/hydroxypyruvate reductase A
VSSLQSSVTDLVVTVCVPLSLDPTPPIESAAEGRVQVRVNYRPDLLPVQRFPADHRGDPAFERSPAAVRVWQQLLATTDVAFGIPGDSPAGITELVTTAPRLRWIQGTAAGAGEQLAGAGVAQHLLDKLVVTSAAGIHAVPLAEFGLFGLLALAKDIDVLTQANAERHWRPRWPMRLLAGSRIVVLGLGGIGAEFSRLAAAFGATVVGVRRSASGVVPPGVEKVISLDALDRVLPAADAVVVTLPGTEQTRGLIGQRRLRLLPPHAVLVNVGRGSVVDSGALVRALDDGALRGAVLDVADIEPLPADSALWGRPNVIISPHTAALTIDEDDRLTALFADNLTRLLTDQPLRNTVNLAAGY